MEIIITDAILLLGKVLATTIIILTVIESHETNRMIKKYLENRKADADEISQKSVDKENEK